MNATIRIPATNAQIQARPYPSHGFEILASVRLDLLAEALGSMEHDDTDPDVRRMNADQCRDVLLREILLGWSPSDLVEAKIPGVVEMAQDLEGLRTTLSRVEAERDGLRARVDLAEEIIQDLLDRMLLPPPDPNCTCHASPPCNDCVEYAGIRETIEQATAFVSASTEGEKP